MKAFLALLFIIGLFITYAATPAGAQSAVTTISKDPSTGVTTTTTKTSGGTTTTEVFEPATGITSTTVKYFYNKTYTAASTKDQTTGTVTTKWTDFDGMTGTTVEETDNISGKITKTIRRSDGSISVVKNDKNSNLIYKSYANKEYKDDYQPTDDGYKESSSHTYKLDGKQYIENHAHEVKVKSNYEDTNDQTIIDENTVRDVEIATHRNADGTLSIQEWYKVITLVYKGEDVDFYYGKGAQAGIKYRSYDLDPKTGKTTVTHIWLEDGRPFDKPQGKIEAQHQPETAAPAEQKSSKQTEGSQSKPGQRPKKEVKHTGSKTTKTTASTHKAKSGATASSAHPGGMHIIGIGGGIGF
jgi:hypothetical protein